MSKANKLIFIALFLVFGIVLLSLPYKEEIGLFNSKEGTTVSTGGGCMSPRITLTPASHDKMYFTFDKAMEGGLLPYIAIFFPVIILLQSMLFSKVRINRIFFKVLLFIQVLFVLLATIELAIIDLFDDFTITGWIMFMLGVIYAITCLVLVFWKKFFRLLFPNL